MTNSQAKSELMQIYMSLSEEKKQALDVLMAQNCDQCEVGNPCLYCEYEFKAQADRNEFYNWDAPIRHKADGKKSFKMREPTPEERESIDKCIKSISKPTGVNFWDLADGEYISKDAVIEWLKEKDIIKMVGQEKEARKQLDELPSVDIPQDHDGCKDCKHEDKSDGYIICAHCQQNYKDLWEREKPTDTITMTREEFGEKLMEHYRQGRADEKAYQNGEIMQSFNPD